MIRSTDGTNFTSIGFVNGNGTSSLPHDYSFNDYNVQPDMLYYYKLKQLDFDGSSSLTYTVSAKLTGTDVFSVSDVYPNPADGDAFVNIVAPDSGELLFSLYNVIGQQENAVKINLEKGLNKVRITDISLAKGTYIARFEFNNTTTSKKIIKK